MTIADYGAQAWAGIMFGIGTPPATFYVALCTDQPGTGWDGSVVATLEPTDTAYERQSIALPAGWTLSDNGFVISAVDLNFATPVADWGNIVYFALLDAAVDGNLWAYGAFLDPLYLPAGYPDPVIPAGSISVVLDDVQPSIAE